MPTTILYATRYSDQHIRETKPQTVEELVEHVSDYAKSISKQNVYKAVRDIFVRADCCIENGGGEFESHFKSFKKNDHW